VLGSLLFASFFINVHSKSILNISHFAITHLDKYAGFLFSSLGFYSYFSAVPNFSGHELNFNYSNTSGTILRGKFSFNTLLLFFRYFLKTLFLVNFMLKNFFSRFAHILSVGLGFRKRRRFIRSRHFFELYMGNRHRVSFEVPKKFYVILIRRGNIIFFSNAKNKLWYPLICFRNFRKELAFKLKGFFIRRKRASKKLMRIWAFARRVKFKEAKTKLSKKQKMI